MKRTKKLMLVLTIDEETIEEGIEKGVKVTVSAVNLRAVRAKFAIEANAPYFLTPLPPVSEASEILTAAKENASDDSNLRKFLKESLTNQAVQGILSRSDFYEDFKEKKSV